MAERPSFAPFPTGMSLGTFPREGTVASAFAEHGDFVGAMHHKLACMQTQTVDLISNMSQSSPTDFEAGHLLPSADDTMLNTGAFGDDADCMQLHFEAHKTPKKMTQAASGLCCVCGATETPQWRSGPRGLNTLCNGCGIRWRKVRACNHARISAPAAPVHRRHRLV